jgi:dihydroorotate dehydrogenase (fumarate)
MNSSTSYLGLNLSTPVVVGASPFTDNAESARELQDAGAGAVVMRSLFEEQIYLNEVHGEGRPGSRTEIEAEQDAYFPSLSEYQQSPDQYLRQIAYLKSSLVIPVIASLNGCHPGGWLDYARRIEAAGADAIELNLYHISTDPDWSALDIEAEMLETVRQLKMSIRIPLAVKLSPFHTSLAHFSRELVRRGADGIVIFNRFYQPEIKVGEPGPESQLHLSDSGELLLRARWISILASRVRCSLAVTGGVHSSGDVIKAILAGADTVQVVSVLLKQGPHFLAIIIQGLQKWMKECGYENLGQFRGALNFDRCPDAAAFERGHYQRLLQSWRV